MVIMKCLLINLIYVASKLNLAKYSFCLLKILFYDFDAFERGNCIFNTFITGVTLVNFCTKLI